MKIKDRYASFLKEGWAAHKRAHERLQALDKTGISWGEPLGASARREFLAMADHGVDAAQLSATEVKARVRQLYDNAEVLFASKRQALVRVGELVCHCNRFGVCSFILPGGIPNDRWGSLRTTPCYDHTLPEAIGAVVDGRDGSDRLHNYSGCCP